MQNPPAWLNGSLEIGVVIVNYQTADLTLRCIESLVAQNIAQAGDIVVVDNCSPDGSGPVIQTARPDVRVLLSPDNGGFAAGVNLGVAALSTELILVLNPDTCFRVNPMDAVRALFLSTPSLGLLGFKLVNPDGSLQYSARRFYSLIDILARRSALGRLKLARRMEASHLSTDRWGSGPFQSDWVMGTGFVMRRRAFESIGRMDDGYFLYFEDVDICARMWIGGWSVMAIPQAELVHEHQRQSKKGIRSKPGQTHLKSMFRFFQKFGVPWIKRPSRAALTSRYLRWQKKCRAKSPDRAALPAARSDRGGAVATTLDGQA